MLETGRKIRYEGAAFQPLRETARITGLSESFLRKACWKNVIPYIRVGRDYRVNVPRLLEMLDAMSMGRQTNEP